MKKIRLSIIVCFIVFVGIIVNYGSTDEYAKEPALSEPVIVETGQGNQRQTPQSIDQKETTYDITELNGYLVESAIPEDFDFKNRLYIGGEASYYLIDTEGNLVRWGTNFDKRDMGWDYGAAPPQSFQLRNILVPNAKKLVLAFGATFVLDKNGDLWGWGISFELLLKKGIIESNQPVKIMSSVKDIDAGDFYGAAVMEDGALKIWGRDANYQNPVSVQENVKSVHVIREVLFFVDSCSNLYYFPNGSSANMDGFSEKPMCLDTNVEDVQYLNYETILVLKTDGTVGIPDYREKRPFQVLAYNAQTINQSGYISEDGNYWHIISTEDNRVKTELEENTAYAVYNSMGDSLRILQNGRIEVGFSESGMLTALSEGEGYH